MQGPWGMAVTTAEGNDNFVRRDVVIILFFVVALDIPTVAKLDANGNRWNGIAAKQAVSRPMTTEG